VSIGIWWGAKSKGERDESPRSNHGEGNWGGQTLPPTVSQDQAFCRDSGGQPGPSMKRGAKALRPRLGGTPRRNTGSYRNRGNREG